MRGRSILFAVLPVLLLGVGVLPATAQEAGIIKHRKAVMKAVGGHMGAMAAIIKGQVPFKQDLEYHAHAMRDIAKISARVFPEGSDFGETRAKAEIWAQPKEFKKIIDAFKAESAKLAEVSHTGDIKAFAKQFKVLGKNACGACHKQFREKKKK